MALLPRGRRGELRHVDMPGIERRGQPADRAALARRVPPLKQHAQRRAQLAIADLSAGLQAQREQPALGGFQPFQARGLGELGRQVHVLE